MKSFKFLVVVLSLAFLALSLGGPAQAADLGVVFENDPLFSLAADGYWLPGDAVSHWATVTNNSVQAKTVLVETFGEIASYPEDLADVLELTISVGGSDLYGGSLGTKYLSDFYTESELALSILSAGQTATYDFTVALDNSVDNDWQGKDTGFDLRIGFRGEAISGGGGGGGGAAPVCSATVPLEAPLLSITAVGENSVSLSWTAVSPVTHYLIAYGLSSGVYLYGNPDAGNVTSFTVSNLSGGTTYYFVVRGINDCAPGPLSNEVTTTPAGPVVVGLPPGFLPGILGEQAPAGELAAELPGEIAGAEAERICPWWWLLLLCQLLIQVIYYYLIRRQKIKAWWLLPLLVGLINIWLHWRLEQNYLPSRFCHYFWFIDALLFIFTTSFYRWLQEES